MGAVSIQTYNVQLMSIADYTNRKHLKNLLRNLDNLISLSEAGDSVAASIYIDLKTALNSKYVTEVQRRALIGYLVEKNTLADLANDFNRKESTILSAVNNGINSLQKALNGGDLYKDLRD